MIDQKEIQRVQTIHLMLDDAASRPASGVGYQALRITVDGVTTTYTHDEVRAWPAWITEARAYSARSRAGVIITYYFGPDISDAAARGLYWNKTMLDEPKRDTIPVLRGIDPAEDAPAEFKEKAKRLNDAHARIAASFNETVKRLNEKKLDPYRGHDIAADKLVAALTHEHPTNVRARKVAQLRAELDRPIGFPAEGRSERAMPRSNERT